MDYTAEIKNFLKKNFHGAIEKFEKEFNGHDVYIYGAGTAGKLMYGDLQRRGLKCRAFLDQRARDLNGHLTEAVLLPEELDMEEKKNAFVIVAIFCDQKQYRQIEEYLLELGYHNVQYYFYISFLFNSANYLLDVNHKNNIIKVFNLLCDNVSKEIFIKYLTAEIEPALFTPVEKQYFVNLPFTKGYSRFVDCGAYIGDTAEILKEEKGMVDIYVGFEPEINNFYKLSYTIKNNRIARNQMIFPCAISDKTSMLRLTGLGSTSRVEEAGLGTYVQALSLDESLGDLSPTFIKMDIEGAEMEALKGARNTIEKNVPDLAISVYHKLHHLWEIPLYIYSINPNYRFYLRTHHFSGMETILYAMC